MLAEFSAIISEHPSICNNSACKLEYIVPEYEWACDRFAYLESEIYIMEAKICELETAEEIDIQRINELNAEIKETRFIEKCEEQFAQIAMLEVMFQYDLTCHIMSVIIPEGTTLIGGREFSGCFALTSITIPNSVTSIGWYAFYNCTSLTNITFNGTMEQWVAIKKESSWDSDTGTYTIYCTDGTIAKNGEIHQHDYTSIVTSPTVTENGYITYTCACGDSYSESIVPIDFTVTEKNRAMIGFYGMQPDLLIPAFFEDNGTWYKVTNIGDYAFYGCYYIKNITIPDTVVNIGEYAFCNCESTGSISIGKNVKTIGNFAFSSCNRLTRVVVPDSVESMGYAVFSYCDDLSSVRIGSGVKSIGDDMFRSCYELCSVSIENSVTSIGNYAFAWCTSLSAIELPNSVVSIGKEAFSGTALVNITIPDGVTSIGPMTFYQCSELESVTIGTGVTSISSSAFDGCSGLTSITFKDTSTWYRTYDYYDWLDKIDGTYTSVTSPSTNATYFKSTYDDYYWYKK